MMQRSRVGIRTVLTISYLSWIDINHGLDQSRQVGQSRKLRGNLRQLQPVRHPGRSIEASLFHQLDDPGKLRTAISAGKYGQLFAVEERVVDGNGITRQADIDQLSAGSHMVEAGGHYLRMSCGVEHYIESRPIRLAQRANPVGLYKFATAGVFLYHGHARAFHLGKD